jgi:hypothetical protein
LQRFALNYFCAHRHIRDDTGADCSRKFIASNKNTPQLRMADIE